MEGLMLLNEIIREGSGGRTGRSKIGSHYGDTGYNETVYYIAGVLRA